MRRICTTSEALDELIKGEQESTKNTFNKTVNTSLLMHFIPQFNNVLNLEANFIIQQFENGNVYSSRSTSIRSSLNRCVDYMKNYPLKNKGYYELILKHFRPHQEYTGGNEVCIQMVDHFEQTIKDIIGDYSKANKAVYMRWGCIYTALEHWDLFYDCHEFYEVFAMLVWTTEPSIDFSLYELVNILRGLEILIIEEHLFNK